MARGISPRDRRSQVHVCIWVILGLCIALVTICLAYDRFFKT
ncbi:hypothetical protein OOU_Y34scaffold00898g2 [Pyricularia oryzae Y34]|nr:hypothetical protein OOU_Y34scaffold00898g2 [Pyricularia oryzae Y34]